MKNDTGDVEPEQIEIAVAAKAVDDDLNEPPQYDAATDCQAVLKILPIICTGGCNRSVMDTSMSVSEFQRGRNTFSKKKINAKPLFRSAQASFERRYVNKEEDCMRVSVATMKSHYCSMVQFISGRKSRHCGDSGE